MAADRREENEEDKSSQKVLCVCRSASDHCRGTGSNGREEMGS